MQTPDFSLVVGHASHVGRVREINEDSYLALTPPAIDANADSLLLVADGVGGANAGEVASGILVESIWRWFTDGSYREVVHYNSAHADYFVAALKHLLEQVNERLYKLAHTHSHLSNMGTTATIGVFSAGRLFIGHVGDTRAYLLRDGRLQRLTADHSWVADEVTAGRLTEEQAQNHPKRNLVNRVLGSSLLLRVDRDAIAVQQNDLLIFASDGLTGLVIDEEMRQIILACQHPQQACDELINWANSRGGTDNITVLIAQVKAVDGYSNANMPNGVAVSSVYLRTAAASDAKPADTAPVALPDIQTELDVKPKTKRSTSKRKRIHLYRYIILVALLTVLLGLLGAIIILGLPMLEQWLPFLSIVEWQATAILMVSATWLGYFLGLVHNRMVNDRDDE